MADTTELCRIEVTLRTGVGVVVMILSLPSRSSEYSEAWLETELDLGRWCMSKIYFVLFL